MKKATLFFYVVSALISNLVLADTIKIAVASNFNETMKQIAKQYEKQTEHKVILIFGATGKHYAQIKHGAPFDAFFAADSKRPELLDKENLGQANSRFTYAIGKIILWSPQQNFVDSQGKILKEGNFRYLSIANPKLAPYGKAAQQVLKSLGLWGHLRSRMVRGENIGQTFQFIKSTNAQLGFIALSQVKKQGKKISGSYWLVPETMYSAIEQQAIMLNDSPAIRGFFTFMKSTTAVNIIHSFGYATP